ncbi:hypothetical protein DV738_g3013, partial [Chaetothyriales sp. CBS 135597]
MYLRSTGALVRATRAAHVSTLYLKSCPFAFVAAAPAIGSRWQSSVAAVAAVGAATPADQTLDPFPDQSVLVNKDTDPDQSANRSQDSAEEEEARKSLVQYIQREGQEGKIVGHGNLQGTKICGRSFVLDETSNVTPSILSIVGRNLYNNPNHPICITRRLIESVFSPDLNYKNHIATDPVVTTHANFDLLGFPADHPGRSRTDTYYVNAGHVLRTHTSAHQHTAFVDLANTTEGESGYTICADVYRRDAIDCSHFPAFHQMEGAYVWQLSHAVSRHLARQQRLKALQRSIATLTKQRDRVIAELGHPVEVQNTPNFDLKTNPPQINHDDEEVSLVVGHLKTSLELLVCRVFQAAKQANLSPVNESEPVKMRWVEAYFPFTSPSFELEVLWQGDWLELLGSGVVQQNILNKAGMNDRIGWAWGIGVERLAMLLFGIPDIRLFWSQDKRFLNQFQAGRITRFEPFSKYPACYKDIAFWVNAGPAPASAIHPQPSASIAAAGGDDIKVAPTEPHPPAFHENDVMEIVRDIGGTLVEDVRLQDEFIHPKTGRKSLCYRINYRSLERTLTNDEVNELHTKVAARLAGDLGVELR